jgi:hypothetical protein
MKKTIRDKAIEFFQKTSEIEYKHETTTPEEFEKLYKFARGIVLDISGAPLRAPLKEPTRQKIKPRKKEEIIKKPAKKEKPQEDKLKQEKIKEEYKRRVLREKVFKEVYKGLSELQKDIRA